MHPQWAQGASWLVRFDIVVLVYLQDEAVQNASTLADILPTRSLDISERISTQLQATDGNNVLFIFDGWDEFPSNLMNESLVSTIIRQPHKLSLHRSTVLITSRTMLHKNKSLKCLHILENDAFTDKGACCIFEGLKHNSALSWLSLNNDHFYDGRQTDPATVKSLSQMLQVNKSLTHLDLSKSTNFLRSEICCIFEGLQHNTALLKLNVSCTGITATDPVTKSLTTMIQLNKSLTHLDLSSNKTFSDSGACCIFEALQSADTTLVNLNLSNCGMTVSVIESLTKMLQINKSLKFLNISRNHLSDSGAQCIFQCLQHNTTLIKLSLRKTCITADPDTAKFLLK